jgi:hypothetical protein
MTPTTQQIRNLMAIEPAMNQTSLAKMANCARTSMIFYIKGERQMPLTMWETLKSLRGYNDATESPTVAITYAHQIANLSIRTAGFFNVLNTAPTKAEINNAFGAIISIGNEMQQLGINNGETFDTPAIDAVGRTIGVASKRTAEAIICRRLGDCDPRRQHTPIEGVVNPGAVYAWFLFGARGGLGITPEAFNLFLLGDDIDSCALAERVDSNGHYISLATIGVDEEARVAYSVANILDSHLAAYKENYGVLLDEEGDELFTAAYTKCIESLNACIELDPDNEAKYEAMKLKAVKIKLAHAEKETA